MRKFKEFLYENLDIIISIFIAVVLYLLVFSLPSLDPSNYKWLISGGDLTQNYLGGVLYRNSKWTWPIFIQKEIGYPYGVSVLGTDSLPIMAIIFKVFTKCFGLSPWYQFFGIWTLICFILQAFFSIKIFRKIFTNDKVTNVICSVFFIISPIMLNRTFSHVTLCGHWIILASILLYMNDRLDKLEWLYIALLANTSLLVHPYFAFMIFPIISALLYRKIFVEKELTIKEVIPYALIILFSAIFTMYLLGIFEVSNPNAGGWKSFSMNLNAPINPMGSRSLFLNGLSSMDGQYEGYNYLGFGLIILLAFAIKIIFLDKKIQIEYNEITIAALFLTLFSLSSNIYLGRSLIFSYNSIILRGLGGIFRAGGRTFWPVWYLLACLAIKVIKENYKNYKLIIKILCIIQIIDLSPILIDKHKGINLALKKQDEYENILKSDEWNEIFKRNNNVFLTEDFDSYYYFWEKVITNNITVNGGYFARSTSRIGKNMESVIFQLLSGVLPDKKNTVYIISNNLFEKIKNRKNEKLVSYIKELDGFKYIESNEILINEGRRVQTNKKLVFKNSVKGIEFSGFSNEGEEKEFWSLHHKVGLIFKLDKLPKEDFRIKFEINPFINKKNKRVRANVYINGKKLAKWVFIKGSKYPITEVKIPKNLIKDDGEIKVEFHLVGTNSLKRLGLGNDPRRKGIGIISMEIEY